MSQKLWRFSQERTNVGASRKIVGKITHFEGGTDIRGANSMIDCSDNFARNVVDD